MSDTPTPPDSAPSMGSENAPPGAPKSGAPGGESAVQEVTVTVTELPGSVELPPEDQVRRDLAFFVLYILVGVIATGVLLLALTPFLNLDIRAVESTIQLFFAAIITLASTIFGFYFASRNK